VDQAGIYIHIPFCERKCTYCNFNTTDFDKLLSTAYIDAVRREIVYWGGRLSGGGTGPGRRVSVDSIFFGGGTPSIVDPQDLGTLIRSCQEAFQVDSGAEITIEINPATILKSKAEGWLRAGINRVSVGVQSFLDRELAALSRTHTVADVLKTVAELRGAGFNNLSLDLIAGLPEQTISDWEYNLSQALDASPEHLSVYLLEIKDGTQLYGQIKRGIRPMPDEDLAADMYRAICETTSRSGFEQYEISNFARRFASASGSPKSNPYRSRHNLKYWRGTPFYGMGCGAHSYDGRDRWSNIRRTESYIESVSQTGCAIADRNTLSDADRAAEALFMGLRLIEGIDLAGFLDRYGLDVERVYGDDLNRLAEAGLVEFRHGHLKLTKTGLVLSNEVFQIFV
jgi:oxygen-independent coproporphyrinogen III oxidase